MQTSKNSANHYSLCMMLSKTQLSAMQNYWKISCNNDRNDINITLFDYDLYYTWGDQQGLKEIDEIDLEEEGDVSYLRSLSIFVP